jgi:hypothetical protein
VRDVYDPKVRVYAPNGEVIAVLEDARKLPKVGEEGDDARMKLVEGVVEAAKKYVERKKEQHLGRGGENAPPKNETKREPLRELTARTNSVPVAMSPKKQFSVVVVEKPVVAIPSGVVDKPVLTIASGVWEKPAAVDGAAIVPAVVEKETVAAPTAARRLVVDDMDF